jgi:hypothetical protein
VITLSSVYRYCPRYVIPSPIVPEQTLSCQPRGPKSITGTITCKPPARSIGLTRLGDVPGMMPPNSAPARATSRGAPRSSCTVWVLSSRRPSRRYL